MRRFCCGTALIASVLLPLVGRAQVLTPSRVRVDTLTPLPQPKPLAVLPPGSLVHVCLDDCPGRRQPRAGWEPAFIIKDSAAHVLAMVPPGDSSYSRDPRHPLHLLDLLESGTIAGVEVLHDTSLVRLLGRGFENGLVMITLTPAGTMAWQSAVAWKATPP